MSLLEAIATLGTGASALVVLWLLYCEDRERTRDEGAKMTGANP